jgi:uncharacterized OB-fold protein
MSYTLKQYEHDEFNRYDKDSFSADDLLTCENCGSDYPPDGYCEDCKNLLND